MSPESPFQENPDSGQTPENEKIVSEEAIRELIETHHQIANAGTKGIILKFSKNDIPPALQKILIPDEIKGETANAEKSLAIKALKIYNLGDAQREYESLKKAESILSENESDAPLARTAHPSNFYDITISGKTEDFLSQNGAIVTDHKIGVIVMDYIEGEDLATLLYKEVLRRIPNETGVYSREDIERLSFNELHRAVGSALGFSKAGGKSRDEGERLYEEEEVKAGNAKKLFKALRKNGFVLPRSIIEQIKNTVEVFHAHKLYHNDLHERNVIIKNADLENPEVYVIDFGSATDTKKAPHDSRLKVSDDNAIYNRLIPLTNTLEEDHSEEQEKQRSHWNSAVTSLEKQSRGRKLFMTIKKSLGQGSLVLENQFAIASANDRDFENFLTVLLKISREDAIFQEEIKSFLDAQKKDKKIRAFILNKIGEWERQLEN